MDFLQPIFPLIVIVAVYVIGLRGSYKTKRISVEVFYWLLFIFGVSQFAALSRYGQPWVAVLLPVICITWALIWYLKLLWFNPMSESELQQSRAKLTEKDRNLIESTPQKDKHCDWCSTDYSKRVRLESKAISYCNLTCERKFKMVVLGVTIVIWVVFVLVYGWPEHFSGSDFDDGPADPRF